MLKSVWRKMLPALAAVLLAGFSVSADTLEMRDGRILHGKFVGGSELNIRFQVNGSVQYFAVKDVLTITFDETTAQTDTGDQTPPATTPAPDAGAPAPNSITVPQGTQLTVRMIDGVDSSTNKVGDKFSASLEQPLVVGDTVVAPKGTTVYGRLTEAKSAGQISGKSQLTLELTSIVINGQSQAIATSDYDVAGKSRGKQSAERIGGGAVVGAVIGAIAGGGKGAAIGAGVGAGAGTAVQVITHGEQVKVPSETLLDFTLSAPVTVNVGQ